MCFFKVFLEMNNFLFLIDASCKHLYDYYKIEMNHLNIRNQLKDQSVIKVPYTLLLEIMPSQAHLFTGCCGANYKTVLRRARQAFTMSISIVLAGVYGFYSGFTTQTSLAAFTIAYITGGTVFGANFITSVSRSMGTVVASVYSIIVLQIIAGWTDIARLKYMYCLFFYYYIILFSIYIIIHHTLYII